jgi:hypothetical protein
MQFPRHDVPKGLTKEAIREMYPP